MGKTKNSLVIIILALAVLLGTSFFALGQFEYYDPYSNSNIDYFPTNPIDTSSRKKGTSSSTPPAPPSTPEKTPAVVPCTNKPQPNPKNTRSVEIRDESGKVFYLSPPKEEISGIRAYPETSQKIFKIIYDDSGMQKDETEIGLTTVDNKCYPKYGYIQGVQSTQPSVPADTTVPPNRTAVRLDPATGEVFNEKTGELILDARYDTRARKIYYKNTQSIFGKVLTDTTGYVNIEIHDSPEASPTAPPTASRETPTQAKSCSKKTASKFNEEQPYHFCYRSDAILVETMPNTADLTMQSPDGHTSIFTITYYNNTATINEVMANWNSVKKKKVKNKNSVTGLTYEFRDLDPSAPVHHGAILIHSKSNGK
jgi:hypothetical protein